MHKIAISLINISKHPKHILNIIRYFYTHLRPQIARVTRGGQSQKGYSSHTNIELKETMKIILKKSKKTIGIDENYKTTTTTTTTKT